MATEYVGHGTRVTLHFSLSLEQGQVVDSTFEGQPGCLVFGDGTLPEGFESLIQGMRVGERASFTVPPEKAFGMPNPNNLQRFPRSQFADSDALTPGMVFSFADAAKSELPGVVSCIEDDEVEIDFNHPLSGHTLSFEVEILAIDAVTEDASDAAG